MGGTRERRRCAQARPTRHQRTAIALCTRGKLRRATAPEGMARVQREPVDRADFVWRQQCRDREGRTSSPGPLFREGATRERGSVDPGQRARVATSWSRSWRHDGCAGRSAQASLLARERVAFGSTAPATLYPSSGDGGTNRSRRGRWTHPGLSTAATIGSAKAVLALLALAHARGLQPGEPHGRQQGATDLQGVRGANRRSREKRQGRNGTCGVATAGRRHARKS